MQMMLKLGVATAVAAWSVSAAVPLGDAVRGASVFQTQKCVSCHSINGAGGKSAPELGRTTSRAYTPALLASLMWNHAPQMWTAMEQARVERPKLDSQQTADLFAYFFAARFFEQKGDAGRGRKAFVEKGCVECHNIGTGNGQTAPAVMKWETVSDPIELARQMWNHRPQMQASMGAKGVKMPALSAGEMNDITVYLQNLPAAKGAKPAFAPASAATGQELFEAKGCAGCHKGEKSPGKAVGLRTTAQLAAAMWNHPGKAQQKGGELRPEEMKRLVGYLWALQFADEGGVAARGAKVFEAKGCAGCHGKAAPRLEHGEMAHSFGMVAVLWSHGPEMQKQMKAKGVGWPHFADGDMADVIAFLKGGR